MSALRAARDSSPANLSFALAALFLAVAGMRAIVVALPGGAVWGGFGYILAATGCLLFGLVMWRIKK